MLIFICKVQFWLGASPLGPWGRPLPPPPPPNAPGVLNKWLILHSDPKHHVYLHVCVGLSESTVRWDTQRHKEFLRTCACNKASFKGNVINLPGNVRWNVMYAEMYAFRTFRIFSHNNALFATIGMFVYVSPQHWTHFYIYTYLLQSPYVIAVHFLVRNCCMWCSFFFLYFRVLI